MSLAGDMLDEATAVVEGYNSYFSFSKKKSGYSGKFCSVPFLSLFMNYLCQPVSLAAVHVYIQHCNFCQKKQDY